MRNLIWTELYRLKYTDRYLALYLDRVEGRHKWHRIAALVFSTSGVVGWTIWDWLPAALCILTAAALVIDCMFMSDKDVTKVLELRDMCICRYNEMELLWMRFESNKIDETQATERFYEIRRQIAEIHRIDQMLNLPPNRKVSGIAKKQAVVYLKANFPD
jgi:hypothetical protein